MGSLSQIFSGEISGKFLQEVKVADNLDPSFQPVLGAMARKDRPHTNRLF
jgi:hypothetical protein